ncbi:pentatricopeptide repeat-containing protein At4g21705, mitochondrial-like [Silene latifolia]|uniref:pentatricopeptide repeat-containing protein At4g21705, mitochondrial-like n=1 Tax=Silene latifolia TaxID=37657 RepID=UPI003D781DFD
MGIPRLFFLKQIFTKPTNSHFNLTRTLCSVPKKTPLSISPEFIKLVTDSPRSSVIPLLEQYFAEDKSVLESEVPRIIRGLRKRELFDRALEVLEWSNRKPVRHADSSDLPFHLDLIGKVRSIAAAEEFFEEANDHSEKMYNCLLNFYVQGMLVDKSLSLFEKMKEMGIASSPLSYNKIMSLYLKNRQPEKLLDLLSEMQDKGVSPDEISYKMCLKACSFTSDFDSMDKLVKALKDQHNLSFDWFTYATVANYYLDGGHPEKAISCVRIAEDMVHDNPIGYTFLISSYAKLGDVTKVTELWQKYKDAFESHSNHDYMVMLSSLMKLDMFEQAEGLLEEWKASGNEYNHRVVDALLSGYAHKGLAEKAEKLLEDQISKNTTPVPISWGIISEGYIKCQNMQKAVQCMEKALQLGPQHKGWAPKRAVISNILIWLGQHGDNDQVYEFLKLMSRVASMNKNTYLALKASSKHGKDVNAILQRLKDDNIDIDEETSMLMRVET